MIILHFVARMLQAPNLHINKKYEIASSKVFFTYLSGLILPPRELLNTLEVSTK